MTKKYFIRILNKAILGYSKNNYDINNWRIDYGHKPKKSNKNINKIKLKLREIIYGFPMVFKLICFCQLFFEKGKIFNFYFCWKTLNPKYGNRNLFIELICYRLLGYRYVKLPLDTAQFWDDLENLDKNKNPLEFKDLYLYKVITEDGDLKVIGNNKSVFNQFYIRQYEMISDKLEIKPSEGDYFLDVGACWGETSLYFANKVGESGKVYAFEFDSFNLSVLEKAIEINEFYKRIHVFPNALWSESDIKFYKTGSGASAKISNIEPDQKLLNQSIVYSKTLDDIIINEKLDRVDFIKYDVEGVEFEVLKGSIKTIAKYRPILIVAIYHAEIDFFTIPKLLSNVAHDYEYIFDHYTNYHEESFIFAVPREKI